MVLRKIQKDLTKAELHVYKYYPLVLLATVITTLFAFIHTVGIVNEYNLQDQYKAHLVAHFFVIGGLVIYTVILNFIHLEMYKNIQNWIDSEKEIIKNESRQS